MDGNEQTRRDFTRRHFFANAGLGIGSLALASLLSDGTILAGATVSDERRQSHALPAGLPHFAPRAKRVIFLFMAGGPSQLELFESKPKLQALDGQVIPASYVKNKRFAFIKQDAKLLGTHRKFCRYGKSGLEMSTLLPHLGSVIDDCTLIRGMKTDVFNHGPAKLFTNTGSPRFGRPSMGSWVTYGIGSEVDSLPGFVVLLSGPRGPRGGTALHRQTFPPRRAAVRRARSAGSQSTAAGRRPALDPGMER